MAAATDPRIFSTRFPGTLPPSSTMPTSSSLSSSNLTSRKRAASPGHEDGTGQNEERNSDDDNASHGDRQQARRAKRYRGTAPWQTSSSSSFLPPPPPPPDSAAGLRRQLTRSLALLDRDALASVVMSVAERGSPDVHALLAAVIPRPSVPAVTRHFEDLERRFHAAVPYARDGPVFNDYSFSRVQGVLQEIQNAVIDYIDYFLAPPANPNAPEGDAATRALDHISTVVTLLAAATKLVARLPDWTTPAHNHAKMDLMHRIAYSWRSAMAEGAQWGDMHGRVLPRAVVEEWYKLLRHANSLANNQFSDATAIFTGSLGWHLGLAPPPRPAVSLYNPVAEEQHSGLFSAPSYLSGGVSNTAAATPLPCGVIAANAAASGATTPPASVLFGASSSALFGALGQRGAGAATDGGMMNMDPPFGGASTSGFGRVRFGMGN
ncbi:Cut8 six-helix bundle-domain-containing protein [Blastocladiella britannica]|nr:Cut8 six-helix bundle-domain-containing protein [Blastocladiella britannica]